MTAFSIPSRARHRVAFCTPFSALQFRTSTSQEPRQGTACARSGARNHPRKHQESHFLDHDAELGCHTDVVRTYGQYCPIARGSEIFAERWTPIIVRNLLMGCETFTEIQRGAPGIPRSLLAQRLALLERHGIVERHPNVNGRGSRYGLTETGAELAPVCFALGEWGA